MYNNESKELQSIDYKNLINLGLPFLKICLNQKDYRRIKMISDLLLDEDYLRKSMFSVIGKDDGLDVLLVSPNGDKIREKLASYKHSSTSEIEGKLEHTYMMTELEIKFTYYPSGHNGEYFRIDVRNTNNKKTKKYSK